MDDKLKAEIKKTYDNGAWSPLELSYKFKVEVDEVLSAIGQDEMNYVQIVGDQVDDAGPGVAVSRGSVQKVEYSKN